MDDNPCSFSVYLFRDLSHTCKSSHCNDMGESEFHCVVVMWSLISRIKETEAEQQRLPASHQNLSNNKNVRIELRTRLPPRAQKHLICPHWTKPRHPSHSPRCHKTPTCLQLLQQIDPRRDGDDVLQELLHTRRGMLSWRLGLLSWGRLQQY
jgi:hypothetical protein